MPIAILYNVPLTNEQQSVFDFAHADHHRRMIAQVQQTFGITLDEFVLDPFDPERPDAGLLHQEMHDAIDALYGVAGYDLIDVNWQDQGQRAGWIWLNAQLHFAEAQATGVY